MKISLLLLALVACRAPAIATPVDDAASDGGIAVDVHASITLSGDITGGTEGPKCWLLADAGEVQCGPLTEPAGGRRIRVAWGMGAR